MDLKINDNYDLEFFDGDLTVETNDNLNSLVYLSILFEINKGHNKQFPNLGVFLIKYQNGNLFDAFTEIREQARLIGLNTNAIFIKNNKLEIDVKKL